MRLTPWSSARIVIQVLAIALFPLVMLVMQHAGPIPLDGWFILRAALFACVLAAVFLLGARLVCGNLTAAGLATSVWLISLFLYPAVHGVAQQLTAANISELLIGVPYLIAGSLGALWAGRRVATVEAKCALSAGSAGLVGVMVTGLLITLQPWRTPDWSSAVEALSRVPSQGELVVPEGAPDVYYIVLDGMSRPDVLRDLYGADIDRFAKGLRAHGFSIAAESYSNYSQTHLSLASSLNMAYLDPLVTHLEDDQDRRPLWELVHRSGVVSRFKAEGYEFVMVGSDYSLTARHRQADRCACGSPRGLTELESGLVEITPFRIFSTGWMANAGHRDKVLQAFATLERLERREGRPIFVFAHVLVPHPPFVFDEDGSRRRDVGSFSFRDGNHFGGTREEYREGYRRQATWLMSRVLGLVDSISAQSTPRVIVLQGDHGGGLGLDHDDPNRTDLRERLSILLAIRPYSPELVLPPRTTPVNVFRVVFNHELGGTFDLLPDLGFWSAFNRPFRFVPYQPD